MGKLTVKKIKEASRPGRYGDGNTLYLHVSPGLTKSWVQRLTIKGRQRDIGLGPWPLISLTKARLDADKNRRTVHYGGDPVAEKKRTREVPTFREAAETVHTAKRKAGELGETAGKKWLRSLEQHTFRRLGDMRLDTIGQTDVLAVLTPMWTDKPAAAAKVRQAMRAVFSYGQAHHYMTTNPAGEAIDGALTKRRARTVKHHEAIPYAKVAEALAMIDASDAGETLKLLVRFQTLTAVRPTEARLATWDEINMEAATWIIPAERMKSSREHRVPLSPATMDVLQRAMARRNATGLLFPSSRRNKALANSAVTRLMKGLKLDGTPHGMRSAFRDWCGETAKPREIAEAALAHVVRGVEGAYFRSDLFDRRRTLMDQWAAFVTGETGEVVSLYKRQAGNA